MYMFASLFHAVLFVELWAVRGGYRGAIVTGIMAVTYYTFHKIEKRKGYIFP